jgi:hypothetical protein
MRGDGSQFPSVDGYLPRRPVIQNVLAIILLATIPLASAHGETPSERKLPRFRVFPNESGVPTMQLYLGRVGRGGNTFITYPAVFENDGLFGCPRGSGLFAVTSGGVTIHFREKRSSLPFAVDERRSMEDRTISLLMGTPTCRVRIVVQKEVLENGSWTALMPTE